MRGTETRSSDIGSLAWRHGQCNYLQVKRMSYTRDDARDSSAGVDTQERCDRLAYVTAARHKQQPHIKYNATVLS